MNRIFPQVKDFSFGHSVYGGPDIKLEERVFHDENHIVDFSGFAAIRRVDWPMAESLKYGIEISYKDTNVVVNLRYGKLEDREKMWNDVFNYLREQLLPPVSLSLNDKSEPESTANSGVDGGEENRRSGDETESAENSSPKSFWGLGQRLRR